MAMALRVVVPPHPLLSHWLTVLRDAQTPQPLYGTALTELGRWLSYEALRDWLPQRQVTVETATGCAQGTVVDPAIPLLAISAVPGGLGLWQGGQTVLPAAQIGHIAVGGIGGDGLQWLNLPSPVPSNAGVLLFWGQLAEPDPVLQVLDHLAGQGVSGSRLRLITAVAAAPALHAVGERHGALSIYTAAIDPDLDPDGRIAPGIGELEARLIGYGYSH